MKKLLEKEIRFTCIDCNLYDQQRRARKTIADDQPHTTFDSLLEHSSELLRNQARDRTRDLLRSYQDDELYSICLNCDYTEPNVVVKLRGSQKQPDYSERVQIELQEPPKQPKVEIETNQTKKPPEVDFAFPDDE